MKNILKDRGSVYCGNDSWKALNKVVEQLSPSKVFVLTDTNTRKFCLPILLDNVRLQNEVIILEMNHGEINKNIDNCTRLWQELADKGADRSCLIINLGGGVVTDLGGFVASTFKRGIEFINIPTSLLAMVDASIGGKNGVDLGRLKNQVGVIREPLSIIVNPVFLNTLPENQVLSGYAEILKHGLISSEGYWNKVKKMNFSDTAEIEDVIWESIEIKNKIVTEDPNEKGLRKTLNFGHTLGHAIESYSLEHHTKNSLLHGEAIAIGMILAVFISSELFSFSKARISEVKEVILSKFPKVEFSNNDISKIIKLLAHDKKSLNGKANFILLEDIGQYKLDCKVSNDLIYSSFDFYQSF